MGLPKRPLPAKLVVGLLSADRACLAEAGGWLTSYCGDVDFTSEVLPFDYTDYYAAEFGAPLWRQFLAFAPPFEQGALAATKLLTNAIEGNTSVAGRRSVNIDPGYVTAAKLVLATTKDNSHRLYIGDGIYAEVTLSFVRGCFRPLAWTYPDYASEACRQIMERIRALHLAQHRARRGR
jgi:hypothetical protein